MGRHILVGIALLTACACNPPQIAAAPLKGTTTGEAFEGQQCTAVRPPTEPDLMGWDSGARANLSRLIRSGVVAARYVANGCNVELELIPTCIGTGATYEFAPYAANERKIARNDSELYAALPVGAARLSGRLKGNRAVRTDYMLAGTISLPPTVSSSSIRLEGSGCSRATHVISTVYLGGFGLVAGERRQIEGGVSAFGGAAGGHNNAEVENLANEGDPAACKNAQTAHKQDEGCAVPLRIALLQLHNATPSGTAKVTEPGAEPAAPATVRATDTKPAEPPSGHTPFPFVLGGLGVAAIGVGVAFHVAATSAQNQLMETCTPNCSPDDVSSADTKSLLRTTFFIGGAAALAGGVVWYLLEPGAPKKASWWRVAPMLGLQSAGFSVSGSL